MKSGFVSFLGRPNAGKSTLLNRIVGQKLAIVSDKPQTTRTRIVGVKNYPDGQVVFVDTPGVHKPTHRMNVRMVDVALEAMREVDVLALVVDVSVKPGPGDRYLLDLLKDVTTPAILALNKVDLIAKTKLLPIIDQLPAGASVRGDRARCRRSTAPTSTCSRQLFLAVPAGRRAALSAGLPDRSARAVLRRRNRPRAGAAAHARRAAVLDGGRRRPVRGAGDDADLQPLLHDPRRARVAEADRDREGRRDDQDRSAPPPAQELERYFERAGLPRPARQGEVRVARRRAGARRDGAATARSSGRSDAARSDVEKSVNRADLRACYI